MGKQKRPRINFSKKMEGSIAIKDDLAFTACLGSKNAREIKTIPEHINLELWYDKHYIIERNQHLDDDGNKRDVPPELVEALVAKSLKHLIFYGATVKNFVFLNHENMLGSSLRTIIKDSTGIKPLTIAMQGHFKNFNKYQFTVITAIDGDLKMSYGQYFVEFVDTNSSILKKFDNGIFTEIFSCQD